MGVPYINTDGVLFDVGSNVGDFIELFTSAIGMKLDVHGFEPNPSIYQDLFARYRDDPMVTVNNVALSNAEGTATLYHPSTLSVLGGFCNRDIFKSNVNVWGNIVSHEVLMTTFDKYMELSNVDFVDYLKIDTEGNEFNVLLGAVESLRNKLIKCGQFEYGGCFLDAGVKLSELVSLLNDCGYAVYDTVSKTQISNAITDTYEFTNYFFIDRDRIED